MAYDGDPQPEPRIKRKLVVPPDERGQQRHTQSDTAVDHRLWLTNT